MGEQQEAAAQRVMLGILERASKEGPARIRQWEKEAKRQLSDAQGVATDCWAVLRTVTVESVVSQLATAIFSAPASLAKLGKILSAAEKIIGAADALISTYQLGKAKADAMRTFMREFRSLPWELRFAINCILDPSMVGIQCNNAAARTRMRARQKLDAQVPDSPTGYYIADVLTLEYFRGRGKGKADVRDQMIVRLADAMAEQDAAKLKYKIVGLLHKQLPRIQSLLSRHRMSIRAAKRGK